MGDRSPILCLAVGVPMIVTANTCCTRGAANGAVAEFVAAVIDDDDAVTWEYCPRHRRYSYCVSAEAVSALMLRSRLEQYRSKVLVPGLPLGVFPLRAEKLQTRLEGSTFGATLAGNRTLSVTVTQFACVLAFASTVWRMQGRTLDSIVILDTRTFSGAAKRQGIYVALSRLTTSTGLILLAPLDKPASYFHLKPDDPLRVYNTTCLKSSLERLEHLRLPPSPEDTSSAAADGAMSPGIVR